MTHNLIKKDIDAEVTRVGKLGNDEKIAEIESGLPDKKMNKEQRQFFEDVHNQNTKVYEEYGQEIGEKKGVTFMKKKVEKIKQVLNCSEEKAVEWVRRGYFGNPKKKTLTPGEEKAMIDDIADYADNSMSKGEKFTLRDSTGEYTVRDPFMDSKGRVSMDLYKGEEQVGSIKRYFEDTPLGEKYLKEKGLRIQYERYGPEIKKEPEFIKLKKGQVKMKTEVLSEHRVDMQVEIDLPNGEKLTGSFEKQMPNMNLPDQSVHLESNTGREFWLDTVDDGVVLKEIIRKPRIDSQGYLKDIVQEGKQGYHHYQEIKIEGDTYKDVQIHLEYPENLTPKITIKAVNQNTGRRHLIEVDDVNHNLVASNQVMTYQKIKSGDK